MGDQYKNRGYSKKMILTRTTSLWMDQKRAKTTCGHEIFSHLTL